MGAVIKGRFLAGLSQDLRYGFRTLRKNPGFTAVAMLALALGIGANTAIFSVVNGVLLQPLSYPDPGRLVKIYRDHAGVRPLLGGVPELSRLAAARAAPSSIWAPSAATISTSPAAGEPEQLSGEYVSASLFPVLGVHPRIGRVFLPQEDREGARLFGDAQRRFLEAAVRRRPEHPRQNPHPQCRQLHGSRRPACGLSIYRGGEVYLPVELYNSVELRSRESHPGLGVVARLKPGVTVETAQAEIASPSVAGSVSSTRRRMPVTVAERYPMKEDMVGSIRPTLMLLVGAVGFVLIIACANVANLLLARSTARKREFAIRAALGADRRRVVRQLLTESLLLSLGGAAIGLLLARWGTSLVMAAAPANLPRSEAIGLDPYVLLFTLVVSVATGVLFGLVPALQGANTNPQESLKEGTRGSGGGRHRAEGVFVAVEVGLAVILLAGAGLMMQSVWRLWRVDPGFKTHNILTAQVALSPTVDRQRAADPASLRPNARAS